MRLISILKVQTAERSCKINAKSATATMKLFKVSDLTEIFRRTIT